MASILDKIHGLHVNRGIHAHGSHTYVIHWRDGEDAATANRFHVWVSETFEPGVTIFKNPPQGLDRYDARNYPTRRLDRTAKANTRLFMTVWGMCFDCKLFDAAEAARDKAEQVEKDEQAARVALRVKQDAAASMYEALSDLIERHAPPPGQRSSEWLRAISALAAATHQQEA